MSSASATRLTANFRAFIGDIEKWPARLDALAEKWAAAIPPDQFSTAELQGYLLTCKLQPLRALEHIEAWVESELKRKKERKEKEAKIKEKNKARLAKMRQGAVGEAVAAALAHVPAPTANQTTTEVPKTVDTVETGGSAPKLPPKLPPQSEQSEQSEQTPAIAEGDQNTVTKSSPAALDATSNPVASVSTEFPCSTIPDGVVHVDPSPTTQAHLVLSTDLSDATKLANLSCKMESGFDHADQEMIPQTPTVVVEVHDVSLKDPVTMPPKPNGLHTQLSNPLQIAVDRTNA